jgi:hypothetical protein
MLNLSSDIFSDNLSVPLAGGLPPHSHTSSTRGLDECYHTLSEESIHQQQIQIDNVLLHSRQSFPYYTFHINMGCDRLLHVIKRKFQVSSLFTFILVFLLSLSFL